LGEANDIDFAGVHEAHFNLVACVADWLLPWMTRSDDADLFVG
jgi:hypothetical protein